MTDSRSLAERAANAAYDLSRRDASEAIQSLLDAEPAAGWLAVAADGERFYFDVDEKDDAEFCADGGTLVKLIAVKP